MSRCCGSEHACEMPNKALDASYRRVLIAALSINAAMFFVELAASALSGSVSLQADALDFLGDAANYVVGLIVLGLSVKWRPRAAIGKGVVMTAFALFVAINTAWHAVAGLMPRAAIMGWIGLLALAANATVAV
jgi:Co/Zn/Cd efflux system component